ncbi:FecR family protein [Sphingobium sp.]|uniref:FecR family protein n=1 Tax=Sphingobium sp. TaxID=1912891 RepID=UPI002B85566B|nr:FecR domain-containing protein [Sphingobium sp.]HUD92358.1 FecR domain-containing protein [Sphingobium sp.]
MPKADGSARDERAAHWALRVNSGLITPEEEAELDSWTSEDAGNFGAFTRAMAANAYFDRAAALGVPYPPKDEPAAESPDIVGLEVHRLNWREQSSVTRRAWIGGGLGAMAAALVGGIGLKYWLGAEIYAAPMGNVRRSALRDGSAVTLNSSAEIKVAFKDALRQVSLVTGEANFDVARDASRPFIVDAGPVQIRVVGTSFLVRLDDEDRGSITVREGIVEVHNGADNPVRLLAGDHLSFARQAMKQERLSMADVDRMGLWQRGEMDLTSMTLADAANEFARYSDIKIMIDDPTVSAMKVAGVYSTSDPAGFARAAALAQGLKVSVSADRITLSR